MRSGFRVLVISCIAFLTLAAHGSYLRSGSRSSPYEWQLNEVKTRMKSSEPTVRAGALEQLGLMRAWEQAGGVAPFLTDTDATVRREAAMTLGWIGNRDSIAPLLAALDDADWTVRQAAAASLQNLTAVTFAFDALADLERRAVQIADWEKRFAATDVYQAAEAALADEALEFFEKADRVRAAGVFRCKKLDDALVEALRPYLTKEYPQDTVGDGKWSEDSGRLYTPASPAVDARPERAFVQAGYRTLGLIGGEKAEAFLIETLRTNKNWACYAAEALADCGGKRAVSALIEMYPKYAFKKNQTGEFEGYPKNVELFPKHDAPHLLPVDRIPRTAYEIISSLSRLNLSRHKEELRAITPNILATIPNTWDATVVFTEEPWMMITTYLLDQAGVREEVADAAFTALGTDDRSLPNNFELKKIFMQLAARNLDKTRSRDVPYAGLFLLCAAQRADIPELIPLLDHPNGWIKIDSARTLMFLDAQTAIDPLSEALKSAKDDVEYGYGMDFRRFNNNFMDWDKLPGHGYDEYNDPSPRHKESFLRALGGLKAEKAVPVLIDYLNNDRNVLEIQIAASLALADIGSAEALAALKKAEADHPVAYIKIMAREALWRNRMMPEQKQPDEKKFVLKQLPVPEGLPEELVFIKGEHEVGNSEQMSKDMTSYSTTDGGPTYRLGRNIYRLKTADPNGSLQQLTHFESGYVADLEVSYDGKKLLFSRNTLDPEPWFHIYEMNADGTGLKQLTFGPYHDVHPNFMPDGRIIFTSTRTGIRDEYHGYPANGLAVMNADGSDIHVIGLNIGRDAEPVVGEDGKVLFTRLELFYSRMKTEWNLLSVFPDGRRAVTLYGPERRWQQIHVRGADALSPPRHRGIRTTQPQSWNGAEYLLNTYNGPMIAGPGRHKERFLWDNEEWAVTTPYKIDDNTLLVAAGKRRRYTEEDTLFRYDRKPGDIDPRCSVDHGLCWLDIASGKLIPIYNDPDTADFEARPLQSSKVPPVLPDSPLTRSRAFSGTVYCSSAFITQDPHVKERGKYIRVIEGIPTVARHQTHVGSGIAWRNHGGAVGRVFGTVPLAADGSFSLELPADRLFHFQVLDSDRRVVGNELNWQYVRPKEVKGCVGCHENPDETPSQISFPLAQRQVPVQCFPYGDEIQYRAKMWFKGWAPDEREERMRTVNSANIMGRN